MQETNMRINALDDFTIELQYETQYTMRRRVLGPEIEGKIAQSSFGHSGLASVAGATPATDTGSNFIQLRLHQAHVTAPAHAALGCLYRKSDSAVMVMKAAEDGRRYDAANVMDRAMDRSVIVERPMSRQLIIIGSILAQAVNGEGARSKIGRAHV